MLVILKFLNRPHPAYADLIYFVYISEKFIVNHHHHQREQPSSQAQRQM